jgi:hypothetical protein
MSHRAGVGGEKSAEGRGSFWLKSGKILGKIE